MDNRLLWNVKLDQEHLRIAAENLQDIAYNGNAKVVKINGIPVAESKVKPEVISEKEKSAALNQYTKITIDYTDYLNDQDKLRDARRKWVEAHPEWKKTHPLKNAKKKTESKEEEELER